MTVKPPPPQGRGKPLFAEGDPHGNVTLTWSHNPPGELHAWAACFRASGATLARSLLARVGFAHREACPIVFLYRHALELHLKGLLMDFASLASLHDEPAPFPAHVLGAHALEPLLAPLKPLLDLSGWSWNLGSVQMHAFEDFLQLVQELDRFDRGSFAFRYPVDKSFKQAALPQSFFFNVADFAQRMDSILASLQVFAQRLEEDVDFAYLDTMGEGED